MNAGKSTALLQSAYNYQERGMNPFILSAALDDRYGIGKVTSRIGLAADARLFSNTDDLRSILDQLHIPILCYGIRTDFRGELFPGSQYLLAWADKLVELKTVCHCGRKATMVVRTDEHGTVIKDGEQVVIGGNDLYQSLCRRHFSEKMWSDK
jgi:thymidine kinase